MCYVGTGDPRDGEETKMGGGVEGEGRESLLTGDSDTPFDLGLSISGSVISFRGP